MMENIKIDFQVQRNFEMLCSINNNNKTKFANKFSDKI